MTAFISNFASHAYSESSISLFKMLSLCLSHVMLKVPLTPKIFFALLQNMSDLEMFKTKIKKIHKILMLLWTFKVAMFSFSTAL